MNRTGLICRYLKENPHCTQRELAQKMDLSLGTVNTLIKECIQNKLLAPGKSMAGTCELTDKGLEFLQNFQVDGALIIAAGFGSRFVPLTFETPKGLLEVFGERMIERQIRQLHEAGVYDITIAVGYLKEKFEYLIDKYQVKLLYNPEYSCKIPWQLSTEQEKCFRAGICMYSPQITGCGKICSILTNAAPGMPLLIWKEKLQSGFFLIIRRDELPMYKSEAETAGLCMAPSIFPENFPTSFFRFWKRLITHLEQNSFTGNMF